MSSSKLSNAFSAQAGLDHQARLLRLIDGCVSSWPFKGFADAHSFLEHALSELHRMGIQGAYAQACGVRALLALGQSLAQGDHVDLVGQALDLNVSPNDFAQLHLTFSHLGLAGQVWLEDEAELDVLDCLRLRQPLFNWQPGQGEVRSLMGSEDSSSVVVACDHLGVKGSFVSVEAHCSWLLEHQAWCESRSGVVKQVSTVADIQEFIAACCQGLLPESECKPMLSAVFEQVRVSAQIHHRFVRQADYALLDARVYECQQPLALCLSDSSVQAQSQAWRAIAGIESFILKGNAPLLNGAWSFKGGWQGRDESLCFAGQGSLELVLPVEQLELHFNVNVGGVWSQCTVRPTASLKMDCDIDFAVPDGQLQAGKPLWEESRSQALVIQCMSVLTVGGAVLNPCPPVLGELALTASLGIDPKTGELDMNISLSHSDLIMQTVSLAPALGSVQRFTPLVKARKLQQWSARHG